MAHTWSVWVVHDTKQSWELSQGEECHYQTSKGKKFKPSIKDPPKLELKKLLEYLNYTLTEK